MICVSRRKQYVVGRRNTVGSADRIARAFILSSLLLGSTALAREGDLAKRFPVNDESPLQNIPTEDQRNDDPIEFGYFLQDLAARAEGAFEKGDYAEASRYYEALANSVPTNPLPFRKLCTASQHLGDLSKAEAYCWAVLKRDNIRVHDHFRFLDIALHLLGASQSVQVQEARVAMIEGSISHLRNQVAADSDATVEVGALPLNQRVELYQCQLALRLGDTLRLTECVAGLSSAGVDAKIVASFKWAAAAAQGDEEAKAAALTEATNLGVPESSLAAMRNPANVPLPVKPVLPEGIQPGVLPLPPTT